MRDPRAFAVVLLAAVGVLVIGCTQPATPPTTTKAPPPPVATAESTKAPLAPTKVATAPTAVPVAKKVEFPEKGKTLSIIVPFPAGGSTDVIGRLAAEGMERELKVPVQVVNKAGAGSQVGLTELAMAKPDGYTIGFTVLPTNVIFVADPDRKAAFTRKSFEPIANLVLTAGGLVVKGDSPYKTLKDLVSAAKANPEKIKVADHGFMSNTHLDTLMFQKAADVQFSIVHTDGTGQSLPALIGGHVDAVSSAMINFPAQLKSGEARGLGMMASERSRLFPDIPTYEEQGYKLQSYIAMCISAPAGTSQEIVNILAGAAKKAIQADEVKTKMEGLGLEERYMDPTQLATYWSEVETQITPLVKTVRE